MRLRAGAFARRIDAERWLTSFEHAKLSGAHVDPTAGRVTFGAWAGQWLDAPGKRPSAWARDESILRVHLVPVLENRALACAGRCKWPSSSPEAGLGPGHGRRWARRPGVHDLRRANATGMVLDGIDLKTAQTRLGDSDPRLTLAVYARQRALQTPPPPSISGRGS